MIPIAEPSLCEEELNNVIEAVKSGWISSKGGFISQFEENFARYCGSKYGIATSSGTTALHVALVALGIGKGDEVIVPTLTFVATANAVTYTGAKPVFVDSHPDYWCIDPDEAEKRITKKTRAIIPVHLYGHPCDMDAIRSIAQAYKLFIIEDAAEAHGAEYRGQRVGVFSDIACFSFFGNKVITTGEGGMCVTNSDELGQKLRILRDHGQSPGRSYWYEVIGFNYRMTNLQAAVGVAQMDRIGELISRRKQLARWYDEALRDPAEQGLVKLPPQMPWAEPICWMYSILIEDKFGTQRDEIIQGLSEKGIETRPLFYPLHTIPPYRSSERFPVAEELSRKGLSLPSGAKMGEKEIAEVVYSLLSIKDLVRGHH